MLHQLQKQNHSLDTFYDQNSTDAEKWENEMIIVFTQTDLDESSETLVSPKSNLLASRGCFSNSEVFPEQTRNSLCLSEV